MTITLFMALLVVFAVVTSLATEAVKGFLDSFTFVEYASNVVVLFVAVAVGAVGTATAYILLGISFTLSNVICIGLMAFTVWIGAMVGYDKAIQLIEQIKMLKR